MVETLQDLSESQRSELTLEKVAKEESGNVKM